MPSPRERYREQVREEAKKIAWEQVGDLGATGVSVNAIAKSMGISGPALYRYFKNRDDLITALLVDAYREIADRMAEAARDERSAAKRPHAVATALRGWALTHPHRYLLVYGTPVPGYQAPPETTEIAKQAMAVLLDMFDAIPEEENGEFDEHLAHHRDWAGDHQARPSALRRALTFWTRTHGAISLEIAGSFAGMGFDPDLLYANEVSST